jgi:hypothetical protein
MKFMLNLLSNPKKVFLIDAIGALLTALSLFGFIAQFNTYIGMPKNILQILSAGAFCLFIYSISCNLLIKSNFKSFLLIIIILNLTYTVISTALIIDFYNQLTVLGFTYFILEIVIILFVVYLEYKTYLIN